MQPTGARTKIRQVVGVSCDIASNKRQKEMTVLLTVLFQPEPKEPSIHAGSQPE
jgi:hypothetical protein